MEKQIHYLTFHISRTGWGPDPNPCHKTEKYIIYVYIYDVYLYPLPGCRQLQLQSRLLHLQPTSLNTDKGNALRGRGLVLKRCVLAVGRGDETGEFVEEYPGLQGLQELVGSLYLHQQT